MGRRKPPEYRSAAFWAAMTTRGGGGVGSPLCCPPPPFLRLVSAKCAKFGEIREPLIADRFDSGRFSKPSTDSARIFARSLSRLIERIYGRAPSVAPARRNFSYSFPPRPDKMPNVDAHRQTRRERREEAEREKKRGTENGRL